MSRRVFLLFVVFVFILIGIVPVVVMFAQSVIAGSQLSLSVFRKLLTSHRQGQLLVNSLALSGITAMTTAVIGLPLSILLTKTDLPLRRVFIILFTIPLLVPPYIVAVAWFDMVSRSGVLSQVLPLRWIDFLSRSLFGLPGCILVTSSTFLPIVLLVTTAYLKNINPQLEESARLVAGPWRVLTRIIIPMVWPGVILAVTLVFLLTLGEFGVPAFLRFDVFPVESFTQFSAFYDINGATASAIPLAVLTLTILGIEWMLLPKRTYHIRETLPTEWFVIRLGSYRIPVFVIAGLVCFFIVIVPFLALIIRSGSLAIYGTALSSIYDSLVRSILLAAIGASILSVIGFSFGYLLYSSKRRWVRFLDWSTVLLFAIPSTVTSVGLITLWNHPKTNFIYATLVMMIFGYIAQYTALTSRISFAALSPIPLSMEEAAQITGAGWFRRTVFILLPLAKRGLIAAWFIAYIFCLRDTGISMMVYPPGGDTLPVRIFTLMANGPGNLIAASCVIMIVVTIIPFAIMGTILRAKGLRNWR